MKSNGSPGLILNLLLDNLDKIALFVFQRG